MDIRIFVFKILVGKPKAKRLPRDPVIRLEDDIKRHIKKWSRFN